MKALQAGKNWLKWILVIQVLFLSLPSIANDDDAAEPGGNIRGKVTTTEGAPAASVMIRITGTDKNTVTDENGDFFFRNIEPGDYTLEASLVGFAAVTKSIRVEKHKTAALAIQLLVSGKQLEEVVVRTGSHNRFTRSSSEYVAKMPLKNMENPQTYSTITSALLQEQLVFSADDALKNAPGVYKLWDNVSRPGTGGAFFTLRGFNTQSKLRNGVAGYVTNKIDGANIDRIEVIKGPSATLFGSSLTSYGGLINRVTKKPYEHFGGEVTYSGGGYGLNRFTADINTPLDSAKTALFRLNTSYHSENSFQNTGFNRSFFLAPSFSYKVNDRLSFNVDAEFLQTKGTTPFLLYFFPGATISQLGVSNPKQLNLDYNRSFASNDLAQTGQSLSLFGQMNYKLSGQWTSQTNVTVTDNRSDGPMPYYYLLPDALLSGNPSAIGAHNIARMVWTTPNARDNAFEIQQNFIGDFTIGGLRNRFTGGLDFYHYNSNIVYQQFVGKPNGVNLPAMTSLFDIVPISGNIPGYYNFNKAKVDSAYANSPAADPYLSISNTNTYSAYVADVLNITDNLMAMVSLRIDHFQDKGIFDAKGDSTIPGYHQTKLSPKFGLVYQLIKDKVSLFGNYQNGFTNQAGTDSTGKRFKPEQANQWEGGIKLDLFGGRLSSTLSYYDIKVKDILRASPNPLFQMQNGVQRSKGFEAEVIANPVAGLNIAAGYAYNDSKYEEADSDVKGLRPATAGPRHMANFWAGYHFVNHALKGFGLGFGGNYASETYSVNSVSQGAFILPSYTVLNAAVFYDQPRFRIGLKVDNITNKEYWIGWTTVNPQMTRRFVGSIAFKF